MNRSSTSLLLLAGIGAAATAAYVTYKTRRQWIGRSLHLSPARFEVGVEHRIRVPMPDGVTLEAEHFYPKASGLFPTILIRTPYGLTSDRAKLSSLIRNFPVQRFVERGYHVIVQSTRGRFGSEGRWIPFFNEAADGRATIEWISSQVWFNGSVGMLGSSYPGYAQWAVAADAPPYLKAMLPSITTANLVSAFWPDDNTLGLDTTARWMLSLCGPGYQPSPLGWAWLATPWGQNQYLQEAFERLPLNQVDEVVTGQRIDFFREWLQHASTRDPYWSPIDFRCDTRGARVRVPMHLVTGWYDLFTRYELEDYAALKAAGQQPYLTVGNTSHLSLGNYPLTVQEGLAWFDAYLKNDPSHLRQHPVRIFVMGSNEWRDFDDWPPPATEARYHLHEQNQLLESEPAADSEPDRYRYDPAEPTPAVGGPLLSMLAGPRTQHALESRSDVICYTTPALREEVEVIGSPHVELYVRSSLPHTDFVGRLCDVRPDGTSINLCDGLVRLEPGKGEAQPDGSLKITIELWPTANSFKRGHRIRLQVCSGAHPRWSRNPGTGEPLATGTRLQAADQTIYHDRAHPSLLSLPVSSWWSNRANIEMLQF